MMTSNKMKAVLCLAGFLLLAGCESTPYPFLYRQPITQGNIISDAQIQQLKIGMTKDQVTQLLGSPVLNNPMSDNRWDYIYTQRLRNGNTVVKQHLIVCFANNELVRVIADDTSPVMK